MTERKPANVSWQSWIERQINDAREQGAFDDLDGHGRPIEAIGVVHDDMWWLKAKLRDEDIEYLPPTIAIRAERAAAIDTAMSQSNEAKARLVIEDVNARIRYINSHAAVGPPSTVVAIDVERFLERWRAARPAEPLPDPDEPVGFERHDVAAPTRWWQRLLARVRSRHLWSTPSVVSDE